MEKKEKKEKLKSAAKREATKTLISEMNQSEYIVQNVIGVGINLSNNDPSNRILAVRVGSDIYDIWKPEKKGSKFTVVNITKGTTSKLTKDETIKIISKAL